MENVVDREQMDEFYAVRESAYDALRLGTLLETDWALVDAVTTVESTRSRMGRFL